MEPAINTNEELQAVLDQISLVNSVLDFKWRFEWQKISPFPDKFAWLVWVSFERPDTTTGEVSRGRGREEIVWKGAELSSVVKTCWVLVEFMVRHELMEGFRWKGARIFNPHNSVIDLAKIQEIHNERINGQPG